MKYITPGTITGLLTVAAAIAGAFGKSELASFLGSEQTSQTIGTVIMGVGALVAGALGGVKA